MSRCDVCGGDVFSQQVIEEVFHIEGHLAVVEGIPARVCDRCGDATVDRQTTEAVRRLVHGAKQPTRQVNVDVFAYA